MKCLRSPEKKSFGLIGKLEGSNYHSELEKTLEVALSEEGRSQEWEKDRVHHDRGLNQG